MSAGWRREVGRTRDAGWQIGVSKTIDRPVEEVWAFITSPEGMAIWLGEGVTVLSERGAGYQTTAGVHGEARSFRELDRVRLTWQPSNWTHDTTLQFWPSGPRVRGERRWGSIRNGWPMPPSVSSSAATGRASSLPSWLP